MNVARRSVGVVLIVALLGWPVNQPMWCQSQHSRAAVGVPAGASPAYKPEPSPSRHSCCPQKSASAVTPENSAPAISAHHPQSKSQDCCSISRPWRPGLPASVLTRALFVSVAQGWLVQVLLPDSERVSNRFSASGGATVNTTAFTVLRL
jgi:hypothetical protein